MMFLVGTKCNKCTLPSEIVRTVLVSAIKNHCIFKKTVGKLIKFHV